MEEATNILQNVIATKLVFMNQSVCALTEKMVNLNKYEKRLTKLATKSS